MNPTFKLNREDLGDFLNNPRQIRAFEAIQDNVGGSVDFVTGAQASHVLTLTASDVFPNQRVLTGSVNVSIADGGAGEAAILDLTDTTVTGGAYGDASSTVSLTVDEKGRITDAEAFTLNSDNVTEGSTNLFFTVGRARAALVGGTGIAYTPSTGTIALANTSVGPGSFGDASHVARFTVDQQGRLTTASAVAITIAAVAGAIPAANGTYANPTSITIVNGIITAIS